MRPSSSRNQGFSLIEVIVVLVVLSIIGFVGWRAYQNRKPESAPVPPIALFEKKPKSLQLCYLKDKAIECYKNSDFTITFKPEVFKNIELQEVVPSPQDDKLALITGSNGNFDMYVADSNLKLTRVEVGNFRKADNSLSWLKDGSGIVFEAENAAAPGSRVIVRYDLKSRQITPLTSSSERSTEPQVTNDTVAFWRYDSEANSTSDWRWHAMTTNGQNDIDLGLDVGAFGVVKDDKLYAMKADQLVELRLANKQQTTIARNLPFSNTGSRAALLHDNRLVAPYQSDPGSLGSFDRLGIIELGTGKFSSLDNPGISEPFETSLLEGK